MRIVIENDQPEKDQGFQVGPGVDAETVVDAGPAPAALLRRFGRIPEHSAADVADDDSFRGKEELNPLRAGAAAARREQAAPSNDAEWGDDADEDTE